MFDEFPDLVETLSDEDRHRKRMQLESLVFCTLQKRYGHRLQAAWATWTPPLNPSKRIVLIERRIHPNLEFLLHNCAFFGKESEWAISIVCSDLNFRYVSEIVGSKQVEILPLFKGNPSPTLGKQEYNQLLQSEFFYQQFSEEFLCLMEMDCYFRKQIPEIVTTCDYIAAPYAWNHFAAGGGLSFRKRSVMIHLCKSFPEKMDAQDVFCSAGISALGYQMPPLLFSKEIVAESILDSDPVGVHQWWTFFSPALTDAEEIFKTLMTLDVL